MVKHCGQSLGNNYSLSEKKLDRNNAIEVLPEISE